MRSDKATLQCDRLMASAVAMAAERIIEPDHPTFLESSLESGLVEALSDLGVEPNRIRPRSGRIAHDWDPLPGQIDLAVTHPDGDDYMFVAELKLDDIDDALWDLYKMIAATRLPGVVSAYLVVGATSWHTATTGCARLFQPRLENRTSEHTSSMLFHECQNAWRKALEYRARPTVVPKTIASRFVSAISVRAFPDYEIRTVAVEEVDGTQRIALRDGWPATQGDQQ